MTAMVDPAYQKGRYEEAINYYNEAINEKPEEARLYRSRGDAKLKLELYDEAISDFDEAITRYPDDTEIYQLRGYAHYRLGNRTEAEADFQKLGKLAHQTDDNASRANTRTELPGIDIVITEDTAGNPQRRDRLDTSKI